MQAGSDASKQHESEGRKGEKTKQNRSFTTRGERRKDKTHVHTFYVLRLREKKKEGGKTRFTFTGLIRVEP